MSGNNEIGCTVLIDGEPINDGCISTDENVPTVLSGLRIIWGRDSTVDQPTASSCVFDVLDPATGDRLIPSLTIGRTIDVRIDTVVYPDPDVSTIPAMVPSSLQRAFVASSTPTSTVLVADSGQAAQVLFPPLAYSDDPFAWDDVPRSLPGQAWEYRITVALPAGPFNGWDGWAAQVTWAGFDDPTGAGVVLGPWTPVDGATTVRFTPPPGVWLGVAVKFVPTGPHWDELDSTSWNATVAAWTWDGLATVQLSGLAMLAPAAGAASSALVFSGRITDVIAKWDGLDDPRVQIIAQDWLAELANRNVGDQPWSMEPLGDRAQRIIALSGQPVTLTVDPGVQHLSITYRDVDNQASTALLQQLAQSAGGILWTATHLVTGQVMRIEDVGARKAALTLEDVPLPVHIIPSAAALANALSLSACEFDVDPVRFLLDMTDTVSIVAIQWMDQTVNTEGQIAPTQRTFEVRDPAMVSLIGARRLSMSSQLALAVDAQALGNTWLARSSVLSWRIEGLQWDSTGDLAPPEIAAILRLLDGTSRNGLPIALTDLPDWVVPMVGGTAVALYVEGGTYTYDAGSWVLELNTSNANGSAVGTFPWVNSEPAWRWIDYDPAISWLDLYGVTYPDV